MNRFILFFNMSGNMDLIEKTFKSFPSQMRVVNELLRTGIRVVDGVAYCNGIKIADSALGVAVGVDRRVVRSTLEKIDSNEKLKSLFSRLISIALLSDISPDIGCTTIEIIPKDSNSPGIIADITNTIYRTGISIRQVVVKDPTDSNEARLIIVLDGIFPMEYIPSLKSCYGVKSIILK